MALSPGIVQVMILGLAFFFLFGAYNTLQNLLTTLPEGCARQVGYGDSGWTTYERCSAEQIKKFFLYYAKWKLVPALPRWPVPYPMGHWRI